MSDWYKKNGYTEELNGLQMFQIFFPKDNLDSFGFDYDMLDMDIDTKGYELVEYKFKSTSVRHAHVEFCYEVVLKKDNQYYKGEYTSYDELGSEQYYEGVDNWYEQDTYFKPVNRVEKIIYIYE